ncbi:MAG: 2-C-methyl-D-erythritol 4-phosphate cytidylyltransferase [Erysipelotrichales bacterium]|nr:2-C-methyl-D-erythritol 4-phosphate cytidylyltransferase [Erysipelotrichales bacterium]
MAYSVVIAAAGRSTRFGENKLQYRLKDGKPVIVHTVNIFLEDPECSEIILVTNREFVEEYGWEHLFKGKVILTWGGDSRSRSVYNGLLAASEDVVLIHDGARPWTLRDDVHRLLEELETKDAVILTSKMEDTVKIIEGDRIIGTINRDTLRRAGTPQGFHTAVIRECYRRLIDEGTPVTDDAQCYELMTGKPVYFIDAKGFNGKVTTKDDVAGR